MTKRLSLSTGLAACVAAGIVNADEGMWTVDNFPREAMMSAYGSAPDPGTLASVQQAVVRLEGGCTGSFVSENGLILTNHHCVQACIANNSSAERNLLRNGYLARSQAEELSCGAEQVSVLVSTEDITGQVTTATAGKKPAEANEIRQSTLTELEETCSANSGLICEAVDLYNGGQYVLHRYRRFSDVRLVFAPESAIAAFGGDPDNFNFPRWCLDMALLRAYDGGTPAETAASLKIRAEGPRPNEPVLTAGHPGSTERLLTVAQLQFLRDEVFPEWLIRRSELRGRLIQFGKENEENYRITRSPLASLENGIKVRRNELAALLDERIMATKISNERQLRRAIRGDEELSSGWNDVETALNRYRDFYPEYLFSERGAAFDGAIVSYARALLRGAEERRKDSAKRLREYRDTALPQLEQRLLAARPFYPALETLRLSFSLEKMVEGLGPDHEFVKLALQDQDPDVVATALVAGTRLGDADFRRQLWESDAKTVRNSDDPAIVLARRIDEYARNLRRRYEDEVEGLEQRGNERVAAARFRALGTDTYPDGTFTLRLSFGNVTGWQERSGMVEPFTRLDELYPRVTGSAPFALPDSWANANRQIDGDTAFNLVSTNDITGGNSGSPLIDVNGAIVGLIFDGNIHSIAGAYLYDQQKNRSVSVHPAIMVAALERIYGAEELLQELNIER